MPDTGRGTCVTGIGGCATSSEGKEEGEVHCVTSPFDGWTPPGLLLRVKAAGGTRSGRRYVERVWSRVGGSHSRSAQPGSPRRLPSAAFEKSVHTETGWPATAARDRGSGGQDC